MTGRKILVTGGAGFIGTHISRKLLALGNRVTILDNFHPQIHGDNPALPKDLADAVELIVGDVRDRETFQHALDEKEIVIHLAAETGTGQSMYEILRYEDVNVKGMATLLDILSKNRPSQLQTIVLSSSRAVYGEGKYNCSEHGVVFPGRRQTSNMKQGQFQPTCPTCEAFCIALASDEETPFNPNSFYGLTKQIQEQMLLMQSSLLGISASVLRFQNVYGPGQSLKNPYTGILAIFFNLARSGTTINVFEDGAESRDFVYIEDVVDATISAMQSSSGDAVFNVGTGKAISVRVVAEEIVRRLRSESRVEITGEFRDGDIRNNFADLSRIRQGLSFTPRWDFSSGIDEFLNWASRSNMSDAGYESSIAEMRRAGFHHQSTTRRNQ